MMGISSIMYAMPENYEAPTTLPLPTGPYPVCIVRGLPTPGSETEQRHRHAALTDGMPHNIGCPAL